jgi:hypothetical protein
MGEAKRRSRHRSEILASEERCIYCANPPTTIEHMPPKAMFRKRLRLSGLEFACCEECNSGTRATDIVAAFFSRMSTTNDMEDWRVKEAYNFAGGVAQLAPGVVREIFGRTHGRQWFVQPSGLVERVRVIQADGPVVKAMLTVFAAKLGMAFYREHVGSPLPLCGGVYTQFYLNQGLADADASRILEIMPVHDTLKQGRQHSKSNLDIGIIVMSGQRLLL